jgi:hypothetical protein
MLWAAAFIALIMSVAAVSYWYLRPHEEPVPVANIADLEPGDPILRGVDSDLTVYLVQIDSEIRAWDSSSPVSRCTFVWVAFNRRFEDPCSGAKWCIDGTIADRRHKDATTLRSYETELNSVGEILVYPLKGIAGEPLSPDAWVSDPAALQEATVDCRLP